jgi:phosphate transport system substrate-binding protein
MPLGFHRRLMGSLLGPIVASFLMASPALAAEDLTIVGTGDGVDILRALGNAFMEDNKSIWIDIPPSIDSRGGIAAVGSDKAVLGRVARILSDAEASAGIQYEPFARLPSAFYVHPSSKVTSLTNAQLADIYSGRVTNWKDVGGADMRVRVVRREEADSTLVVLRATMPRWRDLVITERSKTAITTQDSIETIRDVAGTIGFGPFTTTLERTSTVLKIDGYYPTDPGYPSSVTLALIYKNTTITPAARAFIAFLGSAKARAVIVKFGSVPVKRNDERS